MGQIGQLQQNPSVFASQIQAEIKTELFVLPAVFHYSREGWRTSSEDAKAGVDFVGNMILMVPEGFILVSDGYLKMWLTLGLKVWDSQGKVL